MKCDRCEHEATVHEVVVKGGKRHERHLCEGCARSEGVAGQAHIPLTQLLNQFITSHMQTGPGQAAGSATPAGARAAPAGTCPSCGTTLAQFKQSGLLGCPECYTVFEGQLSPLLQRAHEGGTHHQGKRPQRVRQAGSVPTAGAAPSAAAPPGPPARVKAKPMAPPTAASSVPPPTPAPSAAPAAPPPADPAVELANKAMQLKAKLNEAVAKEKYEEAARIRDELIKLEEGAAGKTTSPSTPKRATRTPRQPKPESGSEGIA